MHHTIKLHWMFLTYLTVDTEPSLLQERNLDCNILLRCSQNKSILIVGNGLRHTRQEPHPELRGHSKKKQLTNLIFTSQKVLKGTQCFCCNLHTGFHWINPLRKTCIQFAVGSVWGMKTHSASNMCLRIIMDKEEK